MTPTGHKCLVLLQLSFSLCLAFLFTESLGISNSEMHLITTFRQSAPQISGSMSVSLILTLG